MTVSFALIVEMLQPLLNMDKQLAIDIEEIDKEKKDEDEENKSQNRTDDDESNR
jgi:hypothetical protein